MVAALAAALLLGSGPAPAPQFQWCGGAGTFENRSDTSLSSRRLVHVIYATPSDGADRFRDYAPLIAQDLAAVDAWWRHEDPTRRPRFDLFDFPSCPARFSRLDIGSVQLAEVGSAYSGPTGELAIAAALAATVTADMKTIVYYDGPVWPPSRFGDACGSTHSLAPGRGGGRGFSFVWIRSTCGFAIGTGKLGSAIAAHELVHNLGAVPVGAPHRCPRHDGHVCDSGHDLMYRQAVESLVAETLDAGRDDYYGHHGGWWDVRDSPWLEHLPERTVKLVAVGSGAVRLAAGSGLSITCPCTVRLEDGTRATIRAESSSTFGFLGWKGGGCTGAGPTCRLVANRNLTVTAVFSADAFRVFVTVKGKGRVTSDPRGIACPRRCTATFPASYDPIFLRARADRGYRFTGWTGACRGRGPCLRSILDDAAVAGAVFTRKRKA